MKKFILSSFALLALMSACNDDYNDQFDIEYTPTDVKNITMTLSRSDYATISGIEINKELALAKDPEGKTGVTALDAVGKNKYFTTEAPADEYLPAFLSEKYPNADAGSKYIVTYNKYQAPSNYLKDFANISNYHLSSADYKAVWGDRVEAPFLSPKTVEKIPSLLANGVKDAEAGDMVVVNYAYSETEPSIGGGAAKNVYVPVSAITEEGGNYVIVAPNKNGEYIPFGQFKDASASFGYMMGSPVTFDGNGWINSDIANYILTIAPTELGYSMQRPDGKFIYQTGSYDSFNVQDVLPATGGDWKFVENADGTTSIINIEKSKTIKYDRGYNSYGSYADSKLGIYLKESLTGGNDGGFKAQDISMGEGISYVWKADNTYGWKGSAYNKKAIESESWLVTPTIDLAKATAPILKFDIALNQLKGANRADHAEFMVSTDYVDDVTKATWTVVDFTWPAGTNWTFISTGDIDLSAYKGQKVTFAFIYKSNTVTAPTIEVKNFSLTENTDKYVDVLLYKETPEGEAEVPVNRAVTRTDDGCNASVLYRFDGEVWYAYSNNDVQVAVVEPQVYDQIGASSISSPATVLSAYLALKFPYAEVGARAAVVYAKSSSAMAVMEFTKEAAAWIETPETVSETTIFSKDETGVITSKISVFIDNSLMGDEGGFVAEDVTLTGGISYVWANDAKYGWKASSYANYTNNEAESWLISPAFDFRKADAPVMTFDEAVNYANGISVPDYCMVKISTNYTNGVGSATWTDITLPNRAAGTDWNFINVGNVDLTSFVGSIVRIAFVYKVPANSPAGPTWEFKNILIKEANAE